MQEVLPALCSSRSIDRLEQSIQAWRLTSDLLRDPEALARVNPDIDRLDVDAPSPAGLLEESAE
jgi:hypothetical protein